MRTNCLFYLFFSLSLSFNHTCALFIHISFSPVIIIHSPLRTRDVSQERNENILKTSLFHFFSSFVLSILFVPNPILTAVVRVLIPLLPVAGMLCFVLFFTQACRFIFLSIYTNFLYFSPLPLCPCVCVCVGSSSLLTRQMLLGQQVSNF